MKCTIYARGSLRVKGILVIFARIISPNIAVQSITFLFCRNYSTHLQRIRPSIKKLVNELVNELIIYVFEQLSFYHLNIFERHEGPVQKCNICERIFSVHE